MKGMMKSVAALAGLASVMGLAVSAQAQTALNIAGASAAKPFVEETPITLCDNPTGPAPTLVGGSQAPRIFMDGALGPVGNRLANSKFITWVCEATNGNVGLPSIVVRYQSTGSSDGIDKPNAFPTVNNDGVTANPVARQVYVLENAASCGAPTVEVDALGRTKQYFPSCTQFSPNPNTNAAGAFVVNMGVSDVAASSFGQSSTGWLNNAPQGTITVGPRPDGNITSSRPVVVPFSIVLGSAVKAINPTSGSVISPVRNLTQLQVEAIFSRNITRWNQLSGIGADTNNDGTVNASDNQTIMLCLRRAGSGSKAAFDQTLMKDASEHTGSGFNSASFNMTLGTPSSPTAGPTTLFGISNSDVRDCIQGNPNPTIPSNDPFPFPGARPAHNTAAAYVEAEQAATVNPAAGYVVAVDGGKARRNDDLNGHVPPTQETVYMGNEKENVRCGKFQYWVFEAFNTRNTPPAAPSEQILINAFLTQAQNPSVINNLPNVGRYWVSPLEMHVTKSADKGPVNWKANTTGVPACLPTVNDLP